MFKRTVNIWENANNVAGEQPGKVGLGYDPEVHEFKDIIVDNRVRYITELLRQVAHVSKRIVAVVDEGFMPYIEDKWKRTPLRL